MKHHTKTKGDIGLTRVISDLAFYGIDVALPISEHLPFDCIGIAESGNLYRIQVKFLTVRDGILPVDTRGTKVTDTGYVGTHRLKTDFDIVAVYCPNNDTCYYVKYSDMKADTLHLRIDPPKTNQIKGIRMAADYRDPKKVMN